MNLKTLKAPWFAPACSVAIAVILWIILRSLPENYGDHHDWPIVACIAAAVFFLYGAANLFWASVPTGKLSQTLFSLGVVLMLLCWLALHSVAGVIVGAVVSLIGFAMLILQHRRT